MALNFRDITLGKYVPGASPVHRADARMKILATLVVSILVFLVHTFAGYLLVAAYIGGVALLSRLPLGYLWRGLRPLALIIAITVTLHAFMTAGRVVVALGPLTITEEGLIMAGMMGLRLVLLLVGVSLLTLTTSPITLTDGLERLLGPLRRVGVPAHEVAMMMTIALRFVPTLLEEMDKIMKAQMARGANLQTGTLLQRVRSLIPILVPLFMSAFRRAEELATAMEARCYRGGEGRTKYRQPVLRTVDVGALAVTVGYAVGTAYWF